MGPVKTLKRMPCEHGNGMESEAIQLHLLTNMPTGAIMKNLTIETYKMMEGGLSVQGRDGRIYPTVRGRCLKQIIKDSLFSAYMHREPESQQPVADSRVMSLEETCMPNKVGIDSSLVDPDTDVLRGKKPRASLIREMVDVAEVNPDDLDAFAQAIKDEAIQEQISYLASRNSNEALASIKVRIATGLRALEEDKKGDLDEEFITRAFTFVADNPPRYPSAEDKANLGLIDASLKTTVLPSGATSPVDLTFEI
jgi:hypothetical protein